VKHLNNANRFINMHYYLNGYVYSRLSTRPFILRDA